MIPRLVKTRYSLMNTEQPYNYISEREHSGTETFLGKNLTEISFEELEGKSFELVRVVEMLCEVCEKPLSKRETVLRRIRIACREDLQNLMDRAKAHDRAEVDVENGKIYFFDHDFPGDVHPECIEKL
jgi:hypothetical protein